MLDTFFSFLFSDTGYIWIIYFLNFCINRLQIYLGQPFWVLFFLLDSSFKWQWSSGLFISYICSRKLFFSSNVSTLLTWNFSSHFCMMYKMSTVHVIYPLLHLIFYLFVIFYLPPPPPRDILARGLSIINTFKEVVYGFSYYLYYFLFLINFCFLKLVVLSSLESLFRLCSRSKISRF